MSELERHQLGVPRVSKTVGTNATLGTSNAGTSYETVRSADYHWKIRASNIGPSEFENSNIYIDTLVRLKWNMQPQVIVTCFRVMASNSEMSL